MVHYSSNPGVYRVADVFSYMDSLFCKYPGPPAVRFIPVPESLARLPLDAKVRFNIIDALLHTAQNGQKYSGTAADVVVSVTEGGNSRIVFQVANEGKTMPRWQRLLYGRVPGFRGADVAAMRGQGMGSVLARRGVESLGGKIAVLPRPGGGTIVRMTVPVADASIGTTSATWGMRAAGVLNSGAKMLAKGATLFLLAVEVVPSVTEATYNIFDDPCAVFARDEWFNSVNAYYSQAGIFGDIPSVPWYQRVGNSTRLMLNMLMPSSLTKFSAAIDPFDDTAKNWMSAKAMVCRSSYN